MTDKAELAGRVSDIWIKFRPSILSRVTVLEDAVVALLNGSLEPEMRQTAVREAHKLAGSVGTFGYADGSRQARAIEHLLEGEDQIDVLRLSDLVLELRRELERTPSAAVPDEQRRTGLLLLMADDEMAGRVEMEASGRGFEVRRVRAPDEARRLLAIEPVNVVVLDLLPIPGGLSPLEFLDELTGSADPPSSVVAIAAHDSFAHRVEVMRLGATAFLHHPIAPGRVVDAVESTLTHSKAAGARILLLDDDPQILELVDGILSARGMRCHRVTHPSSFWGELSRVLPDLIILDFDMPGLNGVDVCRALRNDPRWGSVPVVFLTGRTDLASVREVFAAGADDYVPKPVFGPELTMRVENRLERTRTQALARASEGPGGLKGRELVSEDLTRILALARRAEVDATIAKVDLDRLTVLNQRLGTGAGDAALARLAVLLQASLQPGDAAGWWGSDEFVVAYFDTDGDVAAARLESVLEGIGREPVRVDGETFALTFSAAVAQFGRDGCEPNELIFAAERTVDARKTAGGAGIDQCGYAALANGPEIVDVVVVEDDVVIADLVRHALEVNGYSARVIEDGVSAVEQLVGPPARVRGRVVLLDVDLPGRDGLTVLREMSQHGVVDRTRVVMLTARSTEREVLSALHLGAVDHISKPFSVPILMARLKALLARG